MKEAIGHPRTVEARQHPGATNAHHIRQNSDGNCRQDDDCGAPQPKRFQFAPTLITTSSVWSGTSVVTTGISEIGKNYCQRDQGHQRSNTTASLDDFEL